MNKRFLWVDDVREPPNENYDWVQSVNGAIAGICVTEEINVPYEMLDLDHDSGKYHCSGGDYIKLLDWLEATGRNYPIRIHSMNPVGVQNMRAIIQHNGWTEVK
jgi:hypothetical protein